MYIHALSGLNLLNQFSAWSCVYSCYMCPVAFRPSSTGACPLVQQRASGMANWQMRFWMLCVEVGSAPRTSKIISGFRKVSMVPSQYKDCLSQVWGFPCDVKDKTIARLSYLSHGEPYTGKTTSLYWDGPQYFNLGSQAAKLVGPVLEKRQDDSADVGPTLIAVLDHMSVIVTRIANNPTVPSTTCLGQQNTKRSALMALCEVNPPVDSNTESVSPSWRHYG